MKDVVAHVPEPADREGAFRLATLAGVKLRLGSKETARIIFEGGQWRLVEGGQWRRLADDQQVVNALSKLALPEVGKVVRVQSLSGGCGATTMTLLLAKALAKDTDGPVLAVENHAGPAAMITASGLSGREVPCVVDLDEDFLPATLWPKLGQWQGVKVLPQDPFRPPHVLNPGQIETLCRVSDVLVIDEGASRLDAVLTVPSTTIALVRGDLAGLNALSNYSHPVAAVVVIGGPLKKEMEMACAHQTHFFYLPFLPALSQLAVRLLDLDLAALPAGPKVWRWRRQLRQIARLIDSEGVSEIRESGREEWRELA